MVILNVFCHKYVWYNVVSPCYNRDWSRSWDVPAPDNKSVGCCCRNSWKAWFHKIMPCFRNNYFNDFASSGLVHNVLERWEIDAGMWIVMNSQCYALQWRHNEHDVVSNHQPHDCLLNCLFRRRSKKTSKLRVTSLCEGNSPMAGESPARGASNAGNVSICWRHHEVEVLRVINKGEQKWRHSSQRVIMIRIRRSHRRFTFINPASIRHQAIT